MADPNITNKLNISGGQYEVKKVHIDKNSNGKVDKDETYILIKGDNLDVSYKDAAAVKGTQFIFQTNNSVIKANEQDNDIHVIGDSNSIFGGTGKDRIHVKGNENNIHDAVQNGEDYQKDVISAQGKDNKFFVGENGEDEFFNVSSRYNGVKTAIIQDSYALAPNFSLFAGPVDKESHGDKVESQLAGDVVKIPFDIKTGTWGKNIDVNIKNVPKTVGALKKYAKDKEVTLSSLLPGRGRILSSDSPEEYIEHSGWYVDAPISEDLVRGGVLSNEERKGLNYQFGHINDIKKDTKEFKLDSKRLVGSGLLNKKEFDALQTRVDEVMKDDKLTASQRTFTIGTLLLQEAGIGDVINKSNTETAKIKYSNVTGANHLIQKSLNYADIDALLAKEENAEYFNELKQKGLLPEGKVTAENIREIMNYDRNQFISALRVDTGLNFDGLKYIQEYLSPDSGAQIPWTIALGNDPEGFSIEALLPGIKMVQGDDAEHKGPRGSFGSLANEQRNGIIPDGNRPGETTFGSSFASPKVADEITKKKQEIYNQEYNTGGFFDKVD